MANPAANSQSSMGHISSNTFSSRVRVVLRVRPFLPSEIKAKEKSPIPCITLLDQENRIGQEVTIHIKDQWTSRNECYNLDSFFGQEHRVGQIFQREVSTVIPGIFQGFNATVFAYGATGSGKTYTMQGTEDEPGLIPLAMSTILSSCKNAQGSVEIAYYEIYMDRCYDLLEPKAKEIMTLDDKEGRLQMKGLSWAPVHSMDEFCDVFSTGVQRRKVAHTGLNDVSSRSHAVLAIKVTSGAVKGKLNLIDLAGNEDNRRTCNEGIRLQESAKINQSLFALSNVIYALNNNEPWIPYRDSKLTRILQDSLGGTSRALMIACLNPVSYQEAVHTVSLAARSRQIVNYVGSANKKETPKVKVDMEAKLRAWLESKGKTKRIQRMNGPCSPSVGKTPTSTSSSYLKQPGSVRSSAKVKTIDRGAAKGRKLFDSGAPISAAKKVCSHRQQVNALTNPHLFLHKRNKFSSDLAAENASLLKEKIGPFEVDKEVQHDIRLDNSSCIVKDEICEGITHALHDRVQGKTSENIRSCGASYSKEHDDGLLIFCSSLHEYENSETSMATQDGGDRLEPSKVVPLSLNGSNDDHDNRESTDDAKFSKTFDLPGTPFDKENLHLPSMNNVGSPAATERIRELKNSLRKVLSPVSSNIGAVKHLSSDDCVCLILLDPKTPQSTCEKDEAGIFGTPLDKFNALSSNLKESLLQEYLAFLNVASKEELMRLKGIGQKRAEYILELREHTPRPLKSLSDLEKIGLSSKQVNEMFRRAARGIFN
ncbi:kinesin-like protein KIN-10C [Cocos nucifera]|uniref:Kinesin-like protein n=1 Tax=Cocos nucifera TaxID=13894 RepID=A0A8K0I496_COCNU|nr:kinesin-like protein KIN-10C [Cocos nucifera]